VTVTLRFQSYLDHGVVCGGQKAVTDRGGGAALGPNLDPVLLTDIRSQMLLLKL
jgi:hypothetical protein